MRSVFAIGLLVCLGYLGVICRGRGRQFAVAALFAAFVLPSLLTVSFAFPFSQVGLFGDAGPTEVVTHDIVVVDEDGDRVPYDAGAVSPLTDDYLDVSYASNMVESESYASSFGVFLIRRANEHRTGPTALKRFAETVRFPPHQLYRTWSASERQSLDQINRITVVRKEAYIADDGSRRSVDRRPVLTVHENGTVTYAGR